MGKSIKKQEDWGGEICGDLEEEFRISSERKGSMVKESGDVFIIYQSEVNNKIYTDCLYWF